MWTQHEEIKGEERLLTKRYTVTQPARISFQPKCPALSFCCGVNVCLPQKGADCARERRRWIG